MREPAVIAAAVAAVINLVVLLALGHELDKDAQAAIVTVVTVLAGLFIRANVSPVP